ncbi:zinc metallopeptidase [Nitrosomonas mobilis]|uniref:Peptidase membrane zinc metallopeptidase n=1 Tax=Nitrosomonas mobilis TaxID=51642 RepID=A0A1G5SHR3_9PROT|nr:zinc metallopeptidase [Nitrosomonas mobilis]SCZ86746.1 Peptidase membrane zinc metallopeptidase [Nitrosomonas mobilis]HNO75157.1 zinc metallopeptidase [Nitrosomonas mobilis]
MIYFVLILLLVAMIIGPSYWVKHTMAKYSEPNDRYSQNGAQLARLLLDEANLSQVSVEITEQGDHYDPVEKAVRLTPDNFNGRSLTAITVAAHEVGHAIQDRDTYLPLALRTKLVRLAMPAEKMGAGILMLAPVIMAVFRMPSAGLLFLIGGLLTLGTATAVHLLTLPMELNASFARALPLLERKQVLLKGDEPHARRILKAAAWTYIAASLSTLLNVARWFAILRRR